MSVLSVNVKKKLSREVCQKYAWQDYMSGNIIFTMTQTTKEKRCARKVWRI